MWTLIVTGALPLPNSHLRPPVMHDVLTLSSSIKPPGARPTSRELEAAFYLQIGLPAVAAALLRPRLPDLPFGQRQLAQRAGVAQSI